MNDTWDLIVIWDKTRAVSQRRSSDGYWTRAPALHPPAGEGQEQRRPITRVRPNEFQRKLLGAAGSAAVGFSAAQLLSGTAEEPAGPRERQEPLGRLLRVRCSGGSRRCFPPWLQPPPAQTLLQWATLVLT